MELEKVFEPTNVKPAKNPTLRGRVVAVDPCYVCQDDGDSWDRFLEAFWPAEKQSPNKLVQCEINGHTAYVAGTAHGDGTYPVDGPHVGAIGVDAGMIMLVPADAFLGTPMAGLATLDKKALDADPVIGNEMLAVIFLQDRDRKVQYFGGDWDFGPTIVTSGSDEDEEDEDWEDDDEDEDEDDEEDD